MKLTVDRIEEKIAVCEEEETGKMLEINLEELPTGTKEGSIISKRDGTYYLEEEEEKKRYSSIMEKFNRLKKD